MVSKTTERETLAAFLDTLPREGYLYPIFKEISPLINEAISNDFCVVPLDQLFNEQRRIASENKQLLDERTSIQEQIDELKRLRDKLSGQLNDCYRIAQTTANDLARKLGAVKL